MKQRLFRLILFFSFAAQVGCVSRPISVTIAITNIAVIDVRSGMVQAEMTLVIENNRIEYVGHSHGVVVSDDAHFVDGLYQSLLPVNS